MNLFKSLFLTLLLSQICLGHEFWLQPRTFTPEQSGQVPIDIRVGMNFEGKNWGGDLSKVYDILFFTDNKQATLVEAGGLTEPVIELQTDQEGQYLLGFTNQSTFIELKADEFEDYVLSDGYTFGYYYCSGRVFEKQNHPV